MTVPIAVVAHLQRKEMASRLAEQAQAEIVSWDDDNRGCGANHQQVWGALLKAGEPWVCVLEDDAVLCEDFRHQLAMVLAVAPSPLVGLYLGRGRPDQWQLPISRVISEEACFISSPAVLNTVGYAVRTELLTPMLRSVTRSLCRTRLELPEAMTRWTRRVHHRISYCRPSLIDHADVPSIIPTWDRADGQERTELRRAWMFAPRAHWDSSFVDLPRPDLRRSDRVERHLTVVRTPSRHPIF